MINIIGAGLAGCEAAYYLAKKGYEINLYEMRPVKMTPAHKTHKFGELVCSNSLKSNSMENASGIMKYEMEALGSLILKVANENQVSAGGALAVDRENFSEEITTIIKSFDNINIINEEFSKIDTSLPTIIATGPLTTDDLSLEIKRLFGEDDFYFFDAAAPIVMADSLDYDKVYFKSRYDKGTADYINCPMTKEEFQKFYKELITAKCIDVKDFELKVFESCMPVEIMAKRGEQTLTFGPLKPVGLELDKTKKPYAVVQLRQDDADGTMYNLVGFQTHLTFGEQKRVFSMIPGLENANFAKYGVMHKNTYINAPKILNNTMQTKKYENIFFAGQISGVEGYMESAASGIIAGINMDKFLTNKPLLKLSRKTILGAILNYITTTSEINFQPMNANFGIIEDLDFAHKKKDRKALYSTRAVKEIDEVKKQLEQDN